MGLKKSEIVDHLDTDLKRLLEGAEELWVVVGLLRLNGLDLLLARIPIKTRVHFIVGVDMPSEPTALKMIYTLSKKKNYTARVFRGKAYYHPKLYLVKKPGIYTYYIGSANCTEAAFERNIELGVIGSASNSINLTNWIKEVDKHCDDITPAFIEEYEKRYKLRKRLADQDKRLTVKDKKAVIKGKREENTNFKELVNDLKRARKKEKEYSKVLANRNLAVKEIRRYLDYNRKFENIDLDNFFKVHSLGHLIPIFKPNIQKQIRKFKTLLRYLCVESIPIEVRFENAINGKHKIVGVGANLVSKVLSAHRPKDYFVQNKESIKAIQEYNLNAPRGLSSGEKYKYYCDKLRIVLKESGVANFPTLDHYFFHLDQLQVFEK